ncbi:uncharacterized protein B0H18DRAFT_1124444 [Fomitopsis serialis]|uniref:uncharacterized protein n=1 Tax=Fomitopsis serialis TaxID=139415 RepID=UPI002008CC4A|nr:uncharacterized protein B0H18DRAFT_1124444 [Neoantrodia serialis]KAH9916149.1 hypothetical protein B0H18DRAFT_1124444 [Neoantrodia serialis]
MAMHFKPRDIMRVEIADSQGRDWKSPSEGREGIELSSLAEPREKDFDFGSHGRAPPQPSPLPRVSSTTIT